MPEARTRSCGPQAIVAGALTIFENVVSIYMCCLRFVLLTHRHQCLQQDASWQSVLSATSSPAPLQSPPFSGMPRYILFQRRIHTVQHSVAHNLRWSNAACARVGTGVSLFARSLIKTYAHHEKMRLEVDCPWSTQLVISSCMS